MAKWQGGATRKQSDKLLKQHATIAQNWIKKGFSLDVVADGIQKKFGRQAGVKDEAIEVWGKYNDEIKLRIRCLITRNEITLNPEG